MSSYHYLLEIALILLTTKALGLLTKRLHMPQVVGALLAGLIFGPAVFNVLQGSELVSQLAEIGVILIMFNAGLETDISELKHSGISGFWVALCGVIVPLVFGILFGFMFNKGIDADEGSALLQHVFIGVILTATSVGITVEALKEMGKLSTKVGNTILAAALIDDILGLICLTVVLSFSGGADNIGMVLLKIVLFFIFAAVVSVLLCKVLTAYSTRVKKNMHLHRFPLIAFAFCLLMAYVAEHFFGVADIIGAFAAGLAIGATPEATYIESRSKSLSYLLFTPIFFASIGINIRIPQINLMLVFATVVLILFAVGSKLVGCGVGARLSGMSNHEAVQVGLGMICRGEVALIVANKGDSMGIMPPELMGPVVIMVVFTAVLTPILLKIAFRSEDAYHGLQESQLAERFETIEQLDSVSCKLLEANRNMQQKTGQKKIHSK